MAGGGRAGSAGRCNRLLNLHVHVLAADGAFLADGRFVTMPPVPGSLLAESFRRAVLKFLVNTRA